MFVNSCVKPLPFRMNASVAVINLIAYEAPKHNHTLEELVQIDRLLVNWLRYRSDLPKC